MVDLTPLVGALRAAVDAGEQIPADVSAEIRALLERGSALPETLTITLRKQVTLGETYTNLELREPTAAEWAQWDKLDGVEQDVRAIAVVSGLPEAAVRQLGTRDLIEAGRYLARFLG